MHCNIANCHRNCNRYYKTSVSLYNCISLAGETFLSAAQLNLRSAFLLSTQPHRAINGRKAAQSLYLRPLARDKFWFFQACGEPTAAPWAFPAWRALSAAVVAALPRSRLDHWYRDRNFRNAGSSYLGLRPIRLLKYPQRIATEPTTAGG
jgi:hypothetical protein